MDGGIRCAIPPYVLPRISLRSSYNAAMVNFR
jgi:hypothetical protein